MSDDVGTSKNPLKIFIYKLKNRLKEKVGLRSALQEEGEIAEERIEKADKLIEALCTNCSQTIGVHLEKIIELWAKMRETEHGSEEREVIAKEIFTLAHEIKDIASLCKYDLAAYFAESLRDYIIKTEMSMKAQQVIIQAHVDALTVVHKKDIKDDGGPAAEELKRMVKIAIDKYS